MEGLPAPAEGPLAAAESFTLTPFAEIAVPGAPSYSFDGSSVSRTLVYIGVAVAWKACCETSAVIDCCLRRSICSRLVATLRLFMVELWRILVVCELLKTFESAPRDVVPSAPCNFFRLECIW